MNPPTVKDTLLIAPQSALTQADYRAFTLRIAHRDDPRTLTWIGLVVVAFTLLNAVIPPSADIAIIVGNFLIAGLMLGVGIRLHRPATPDWQVPWVFVAIMTVFVWWMCVIFLQDPIESNLIYIVVTMTALGPLSFGWRPFIVSGTVMMIGCVVALLLVDRDNAIDWTVGFLAALVVSGVLLRLRLHLLRELADAECLSQGQSTSDALTSLLNRRGLHERIGTMWADALRRRESVNVYFLDVRGLKKANDERGHNVGDQVLRDVADAIRLTVRGGDLTARWGGDEFVIVGSGDGLSAEGMADRLNARFSAESQVRRAGWIGPISVGYANGEPGTSSFEDLLLAADKDMYATRATPSATHTITPIVLAGAIHYYATCMLCAHSTTTHPDARTAREELEGHACAGATPGERDQDTSPTSTPR